MGKNNGRSRGDADAEAPIGIRPSAGGSAHATRPAEPRKHVIILEKGIF